MSLLVFCLRRCVVVLLRSDRVVASCRHAVGLACWYDIALTCHDVIVLRWPHVAVILTGFVWCCDILVSGFCIAVMLCSYVVALMVCCYRSLLLR